MVYPSPLTHISSFPKETGATNTVNFPLLPHLRRDLSSVSLTSQKAVFPSIFILKYVSLPPPPPLPKSLQRRATQRHLHLRPPTHWESGLNQPHTACQGPGVNSLTDPDAEGYGLCGTWPCGGPLTSRCLPLQPQVTSCLPHPPSGLPLRQRLRTYCSTY